MYRFDPIIKHMIWGSEIWVISGVPGNESIVSEGSEAGMKITDLFSGKFPLLIKFIHAERDLSIQVHPGDRIAAERHGCSGKDEMWYVTGASAGARLICGFKDGTSKEQYTELIKDESIISILAQHYVQKGDVFFIPAGRVHSIGGGCSVLEVQQASDITYRIYDYGRPGADGKPRQLHTKEAEDAIDFNIPTDYRTHYPHTRDENVRLVSCPHFTTELLDLTHSFTYRPCRAASFTAMVCVEGEGSLNGRGISAGEAVLMTGEDGEMILDPDEKGMKILIIYTQQSTI